MTDPVVLYRGRPVGRKETARVVGRTRIDPDGTEYRRQPPTPQNPNGRWRKIKPHGTHARYMLHLQDKERACIPCADAHKEYIAAQRRPKQTRFQRGPVRDAALTRMVRSGLTDIEIAERLKMNRLSVERARRRLKLPTVEHYQNRKKAS